MEGKVSNDTKAKTSTQRETPASTATESSPNTETESESIGREIRDTVSSGEGSIMAKTFLIYAFDRPRLVNAILTQDFQGLTKPIKYFLIAFGIASASAALFVKSDVNETLDKTGKVLDAIKPYIILLTITGPYAVLMHYFLGNHGRRLSDTVRVILYSVGSLCLIGAALFPFPNFEKTWPGYILAPLIIYLALIRPYQIIHMTHRVGLGRYVGAAVLSNLVGIIPAMLISSVLVFVLTSIGLM
jgi:hypothetical protein